MINFFTKRYLSTLKIPLEAIKRLRQETAAPMGQCRKALEESNLSHDAAVQWLKQKGLATAQKRSQKQTKQGVVASFMTPCRRKAVMLQVNCETDFVAKNELFLKFVSGVGNKFLQKQQPIALQGSPDQIKTNSNLLLESIQSTNLFAEAGAKNLNEQLKLVISKLQQNIRISRAVTLNAQNCRYGSYVHRSYVPNIGLQACVVQISADPQPSQEQHEQTINEFADDMACQILGMPPKYLSFQQIPQQVINEQNQKVKTQMSAILNKAPEHMHEKIVSGKLMTNFYSQALLGCMPYLLSNQGKPVSQIWSQVEQNTGSNISIIKSSTWQVK